MAHVLCIGHAVQDFIFHVTSMPTTAAKHRSDAFESIGGGPAATAAVAIARLGGRASLASRTGNDVIGDIIVRELESFGVDCALVKRIDDRRSSVSAVLVDAGGERLIVNHLDTDIETDAQWLPEPVSIGADAVLADTRWPEGALRGFEMARQNGIPAVLDADVPVPDDDNLLQAATHVAFSADGLRDLTGESELEPALRSVANRTDAWCCVTAGDKGTLILSSKTAAYQAAYRVEVCDTVGAGDVWHGAFALGLAESMECVQAVNFAGAAAALKVRNGGARHGAPTRPAVERFIRENTVRSDT